VYYEIVLELPQNDIIAILEALVPSLKHYYEELADIIFGAIDYTAAQIDQQHRVIAVLFTIVKNSDQTRFTGKIRLAILSVLSAWPNESRELKNSSSKTTRRSSITKLLLSFGTIRKMLVTTIFWKINFPK
ncbi:hypothetical protein AAULR_24011, partial [Lacticaseibacillus rhamnosus MTCC 5462]